MRWRRIWRGFRPLTLFLMLAVAEGKVISREEALGAAFPGAEIRSGVVFLTDSETKEIARISGVDVPTALVARYTAVQGGEVIGRAYLDTHTVRTKKESLLIILDAAAKVKRIEVVAFLEPPEYAPPDRWYQQFEQKQLNDRLRVGGEIHPLTGATLSARVTTDAVRRVLATDQLLQKREKQP